jgi:hypothetical protein
VARGVLRRERELAVDRARFDAEAVRLGAEFAGAELASRRALYADLLQEHEQAVAVALAAYGAERQARQAALRRDLSRTARDVLLRGLQVALALEDYRSLASGRDGAPRDVEEEAEAPCPWADLDYPSPQLHKDLREAVLRFADPSSSAGPSGGKAAEPGAAEDRGSDADGDAEGERRRQRGLAAARLLLLLHGDAAAAPGEGNAMPEPTVASVGAAGLLSKASAEDPATEFDDDASADDSDLVIAHRLMASFNLQPTEVHAALDNASLRAYLSGLHPWASAAESLPTVRVTDALLEAQARTRTADGVVTGAGLPSVLGEAPVLDAVGLAALERYTQGILMGGIAVPPAPKGAFQGSLVSPAPFSASVTSGHLLEFDPVDQLQQTEFADGAPPSPSSQAAGSVSFAPAAAPESTPSSNAVTVAAIMALSTVDGAMEAATAAQTGGKDKEDAAGAEAATTVEPIPQLLVGLPAFFPAAFGVDAGAATEAASIAAAKAAAAASAGAAAKGAKGAKPPKPAEPAAAKGKPPALTVPVPDPASVVVSTVAQPLAWQVQLVKEQRKIAAEGGVSAAQEAAALDILKRAPTVGPSYREAAVAAVLRSAAATAAAANAAAQAAAAQRPASKPGSSGNRAMKGAVSAAPSVHSVPGMPPNGAVSTTANLSAALSILSNPFLRAALSIDPEEASDVLGLIVRNLRFLSGSCPTAAEATKVLREELQKESAQTPETEDCPTVYRWSPGPFFALKDAEQDGILPGVGERKSANETDEEKAHSITYSPFSQCFPTTVALVGPPNSGLLMLAQRLAKDRALAVVHPLALLERALRLAVDESCPLDNEEIPNSSYRYRLPVDEHLRLLIENDSHFRSELQEIGSRTITREHYDEIIVDVAVAAIRSLERAFGRRGTLDEQLAVAQAFSSAATATAGALPMTENNPPSPGELMQADFAGPYDLEGTSALPSLMEDNSVVNESFTEPGSAGANQDKPFSLPTELPRPMHAIQEGNGNGNSPQDPANPSAELQGWVCVGCPSTRAQAERMERLLTGFSPEYGFRALGADQESRMAAESSFPPAVNPAQVEEARVRLMKEAGLAHLLVPSEGSILAGSASAGGSAAAPLSAQTSFQSVVIPDRSHTLPGSTAAAIDGRVTAIGSSATGFVFPSNEAAGFLRNVDVSTVGDLEVPLLVAPVSAPDHSSICMTEAAQPFVLTPPIASAVAGVPAAVSTVFARLGIRWPHAFSTVLRLEDPTPERRLRRTLGWRVDTSTMVPGSAVPADDNGANNYASQPHGMGPNGFGGYSGNDANGNNNDGYVLEVDTMVAGGDQDAANKHGLPTDLPSRLAYPGIPVDTSLPAEITEGGFVPGVLREMPISTNVALLPESQRPLIFHVDSCPPPFTHDAIGRLAAVVSHPAELGAADVGCRPGADGAQVTVGPDFVHGAEPFRPYDADLAAGGSPYDDVSLPTIDVPRFDFSETGPFKRISHKDNFDLFEYAAALGKSLEDYEADVVEVDKFFATSASLRVVNTTTGTANPVNASDDPLAPRYDLVPFIVLYENILASVDESTRSRRDASAFRLAAIREVETALVGESAAALKERRRGAMMLRSGENFAAAELYSQWTAREQLEQEQHAAAAALAGAPPTTVEATGSVVSKASVVKTAASSAPGTPRGPAKDDLLQLPSTSMASSDIPLDPRAAASPTALFALSVTDILKQRGMSEVASSLVLRDPASGKLLPPPLPTASDKHKHIQSGNAWRNAPEPPVAVSSAILARLTRVQEQHAEALSLALSTAEKASAVSGVADANAAPKLTPITAKMPLPNALYALWSDGATAYANSVSQLMFALRRLEISAAARLGSHRRRLLQYVSGRPVDDIQIHVAFFQRLHNDLGLLESVPAKPSSAEAAAQLAPKETHFQSEGGTGSNMLETDRLIRDTPAVKEELSLRLEEAALRAWDVVDAREVAATSHLAAVRSDGWIEDVQNAVAAVYCGWVQAETSRLSLARTVLCEYYAAAEGHIAADPLGRMAAAAVDVADKKFCEAVADAVARANAESEALKAQAAGGAAAKGKPAAAPSGAVSSADPVARVDPWLAIVMKTLESAGGAALAAAPEDGINAQALESALLSFASDLGLADVEASSLNSKKEKSNGLALSSVAPADTASFVLGDHVLTSAAPVIPTFQSPELAEPSLTSVASVTAPKGKEAAKPKGKAAPATGLTPRDNNPFFALPAAPDEAVASLVVPLARFLLVLRRSSAYADSIAAFAEAFSVAQARERDRRITKERAILATAVALSRPAEDSSKKKEKDDTPVSEKPKPKAIVEILRETATATASAAASAFPWMDEGFVVALRYEVRQHKRRLLALLRHAASSVHRVSILAVRTWQRIEGDISRAALAEGACVEAFVQTARDAVFSGRPLLYELRIDRRPSPISKGLNVIDSSSALTGQPGSVTFVVDQTMPGPGLALWQLAERSKGPMNGAPTSLPDADLMSMRAAISAVTTTIAGGDLENARGHEPLSATEVSAVCKALLELSRHQSGADLDTASDYIPLGAVSEAVSKVLFTMRRNPYLSSTDFAALEASIRARIASFCQVEPNDTAAGIDWRMVSCQLAAAAPVLEEAHAFVDEAVAAISAGIPVDTDTEATPRSGFSSKMSVSVFNGEKLSTLYESLLSRADQNGNVTLENAREVLLDNGTELVTDTQKSSAPSAAPSPASVATLEPAVSWHHIGYNATHAEQTKSIQETLRWNAQEDRNASGTAFNDAVQDRTTRQQQRNRALVIDSLLVLFARKDGSVNIDTLMRYMARM